MATKKEGHLLATEYQQLPDSQRDFFQNNAASCEGEVQDIFAKLPSQYHAAAFALAKVSLIALLSNWAASWTNGAINSNMIFLIFSVLVHQCGFLETNILNKAGVYNWLIYGLLAYIFAQLSITTPKQVGGIVLQIIVLIVLGLWGMFIAFSLLAKPFKMSWQMAYACSSTSLFGYPADYILTSEISHEVATSKEEENYLLKHMMPKMLVGGLATVSVASIIIASIFLKLL